MFSKLQKKNCEKFANLSLQFGVLIVGETVIFSTNAVLHPLFDWPKKFGEINLLSNQLLVNVNHNFFAKCFVPVSICLVNKVW